MRSDVLQAAEHERVVVTAVPEVAPQRSLATIGVVELASRESIVHQEHEPAPQPLRDARGPGASGRSDFRDVPDREPVSDLVLDRLHGLAQPRIRTPRAPYRPAGFETDAVQDHPVGGHLEPLDRHRVQHFVGQDHTAEPGLGKGVDPAHARERIGYPRLDGLALPRGHHGAQLQDAVADGSPRQQIGQHLRRHRAGTRSDLDHLSRPDQRKDLVDLARHGARKQWRYLGCGHEIALGSERAQTGPVVPEPGGIEHHLHVAGERNHPLVGFDLCPDERVHPLDMRLFAFAQCGKSGQRPHHSTRRAAGIMGLRPPGDHDPMPVFPRAPTGHSAELPR